MTWKQFFNITLVIWMLSSFLSIFVKADCYDPCNDVGWCTKTNPCLGGPPSGPAAVQPLSAIVECEIEWTGPFACCCTAGADCCQYKCYSGICYPTLNKATYADNGQRVTGARCEDGYCKARS
jgi:hypothetical protein